MKAARKFHRRGLTLIEALLLVTTMSIVSVAAGIGLHAVAKVPTQTSAIMGVNTEIVSRMEQMKAEPWASMSTKATSLTNTSPGVLIDGKYYSCTVTVAAADADGDAVTETDYRQITVTIGSQSMTSYVVNPS